ncbi:MAG: histidine triad nucleotide-binding protein [Chthoniobacterales bacterium]
MTLFEKLIQRELPSDIVFEDDDVFAFRDIAPQAPVHILVIPKKLITRVGEAQPGDVSILGKLLLTTAEIARELGLSENGYRLVINNGNDAGEAVPHLHVHLLAGRKLTWPPG